MHSHKEWVRDTFDRAAPEYGEKAVQEKHVIFGVTSSTHL